MNVIILPVVSLALLAKNTEQPNQSDEPVDSRSTLYGRTEETESETGDLEKRVSLMRTKSNNATVDAVATKIEALKLEKEVLEALNITKGINMNDILVSLRSSVGLRRQTS